MVKCLLMDRWAHVEVMKNGERSSENISREGLGIRDWNLSSFLLLRTMYVRYLMALRDINSIRE